MEVEGLQMNLEQARQLIGKYAEIIIHGDKHPYKGIVYSVSIVLDGKEKIELGGHFINITEVKNWRVHEPGEWQE